MHPEYTLKQISRFWSRVDRINDSDSCWNWMAGTFNSGYGRFKVGQDFLAHRVSWELTFGEIPSHLFVCHSCDNPLCVRPSHLFLGTHLENMLDMANKNRAPRNTGETNGIHKLTWEKVTSIRERYATGQISQFNLAAEYQVTYSTIWRIIKNKSWVIKQSTEPDM